MKSPSKPFSARTSELAGAAFLMATSAIGPGFLTQTALFTSRLGVDFAASILISAVFDMAVQLTIWRVMLASSRRAPDLANAVLFGSGSVLTLVIVLGGLVFNIGNVAGSGLGLESALGLDIRIGAVLSALFACGIFLIRRAMQAMDRFAQAMGVVMIAATLFVVWNTAPPLSDVVVRTVAPQRFDIQATLTLVGGTVGGYITFAGGHRLLDAGFAGVAAVPRATMSATLGIVVATIMRVLLFLAALGVAQQHGTLDTQNPAASVFTLALGGLGTRLFGVVMWAAAITSVIGSAYTSVSFLRFGFSTRVSPSSPMNAFIERYQSIIIVLFIIVSTTIFLVVGNPVQTLVMAGLVNAFVIPFAVGIMLLAARKPNLVGDYRHPVWLTVSGGAVAALLLGMSIYALLP